MDKIAIKRWRPVIRAIVENQTLDEAVDSILLLLEAPGQKVVMVAPVEDSVARRGAPKLRSVAGGRADDGGDGDGDGDAEPPAHHEDKQPLDAFAFFTVEEGAAYLGIGRDRMYQLLRSDPGKIPHMKEPGVRGRDEYRLSGRGLNAYRIEREKAKSANGAQVGREGS